MPVTHHLQSFVHLFTFRRGSSSVSAGRRPLRTAVVSPLTTLAETVTSTLLISKGIATPRLYPSFASWRFCTCNIWLVCQLACPRLKHLVNSRPRCELCTRPQHLFSLTPKHVPSTRPKPCKYNVLVSRRNLGEIRTHALFYVFSHMHVYHSINSISSLRYMLIYHCSLSLCCNKVTQHEIIKARTFMISINLPMSAPRRCLPLARGLQTGNGVCSSRCGDRWSWR